jgi:streptomycin 6-kinase
MQDQAALREAGEKLGPQGDEASEVACALLAPLHKPKDPDMGPMAEGSA